MRPLKRYKNFKLQVAKIFANEVFKLSKDIENLYNLLKNEGVKEFITIFQEGESAIKIRPVIGSDKHLYFNNIEGFSLDDFDKAILIIDHIFKTNGFMCGINKNGDFIFSQMSLDGNSPYLHIKKGKKTIVYNDFEDLSYILFILGAVLEAIFEYEDIE